MGQVSKHLRNIDGGYSHWCPGCSKMHAINTDRADRPCWTFNGDLERPSFSPSVNITGKQTVKDAEGKWTGEWVRDAAGNALDMCCHYFITDGKIMFCGDTTHSLSGQTVDLPELPPHARDQ